MTCKSSNCKKIAQNINNYISSEEFASIARRQANHFVRERSLSLKTLVHFLISNLTSSLQHEWFRFSGDTTLSAAAICKQRDKLDPQALVHLNQFIVDQAPVKPWNGLRLLAVDGSTLNLPNHDSTIETYGVIKQHKRPQARISQLYDINNQLTIDMQIAPTSTGERDMARQHLKCCRAGDLLIADRGYSGNAFWQACLNTNIDFCVRVPKNHNTAVFRFYHGNAVDQLHCDGRLTKPVRFIRVPLDGEEDEVLVTTLTDQKRFPADGFKELYFKRWGVEEDYKKLKTRLNIEQFSGKKLRSVLQDIHATVIHKNLVALGVVCAQAVVDKRPSTRKHPQKVNFTQAIRIAKQAWTQVGDWKLARLVHQMAEYCHDASRNRKCVRNKRSKQPPAMAYKLGGA